jgi:hypothetical protein
MKRVSILAVLTTVVVLGLVVVTHAPRIGAQDTEMAEHPLVGTWLLDTDADDPTNAPTLGIFTADGIYAQVEADGAVGMGSWHATGPNMAEMTFHGLFGAEEGEFFGMATIRSAIEVASDGQSLTATFTLEFTDPDGTSSGEYGPGNVTGTKVVVEPMGTPVGPLETLFEEEGTPEASPEA